MIFWGATGQAKVLNECISELDIELMAVFDNNHRLQPSLPGVPLFYGREGFNDWYSLHKNETIYFLVAIGGNNGKDRLEIQDYLQQQGLLPYTAVHSTAVLAKGVTPGSGSQILARSVICTEVQIGRASIINTGAVIDHECIIGDGVHICPGAVLAGCVEVENYAMVGTGAVILPRVKIHEGAVIGAGSVVNKDIPPYSVAAGNPARLLRRLAIDEQQI